MSRRYVSMFALLLLAAPLAAQTTAPGRLPVPSAAQQARAREMIRKIYEKPLAKTGLADRRALAKTMLAQAQDTADDPAARYVLLIDAAELAANAADASAACGALETAARFYETGPVLTLQRGALIKAHAALAGPTLAADAEAIMRLALDAAQRAAREDDVAAVTQLANLAEGAANRTLSVRIVSSIQSELHLLREIVKEYEAVRAALARLERVGAAQPSATAPSAAADRLLIGRYYALRKGQWDLGLPHLAEGADETLRTLAQKELAAAGETATLELADGWWDYAQKVQGAERVHATARAQSLYRNAEATLKGITLARIHSRLAAKPSDTATPQTAVAGIASVNLLSLIDPAKDACAGAWSAADNTLTCTPGPYATLQLPFTPPDEYDLTVAFTRAEGAGPVALLLTGKGRAFGFSADVRGEARFERINGKVAQDNPTVVPVAISNGRRHTLTVQVRKDSLRALLDGKLLVEHKPDPAYKDLSRYPSWKLTDTTLPGVGAHNARVLFHSIDLVEIAGKGKPTR